MRKHFSYHEITTKLRVYIWGSSGGTVTMLHHPWEQQTNMFSTTSRRAMGHAQAPNEWGLSLWVKLNTALRLRWSSSTCRPAIPWPLHATTIQSFNKLH